MQIFVRLLDRKLKVIDADRDMTIYNVIQRLPSPMREATHQVSKNSEGKQRIYLCRQSIRLEPEKTLGELGIEADMELEMRVKYVRKIIF
jgi:hypothetical protein